MARQHSISRADQRVRDDRRRCCPPPFEAQAAAFFAPSELSLNLTPAEHAQPIVQPYVGCHVRAERVGDALVEVLEQAGRLDTMAVEHPRLL